MTESHRADQAVTHAIRSWLHEDRREDVSRIAASVLDQLDTTRQRRVSWWPVRSAPTAPRVVGFGLAAVAVVALLVVGSQLLDRMAPGGLGADSTPTATPRMVPSAGALEPGAYRLADPAYTPVDLVVTVPAGWAMDSFRTFAKHPGGRMEVGLAPDVVAQVYRDACGTDGALVDVCPTAEDLIAALTAQRNVVVTGPTAVTLGGHPAQRLDLAVPSGLDLAACGGAESIRIWVNEAVPVAYMLSAGHAGSVYVADVDGHRVVIATDTGPDALAADVAERDAIVRSVRIEP
jgi:hypothetical protein